MYGTTRSRWDVDSVDRDLRTTHFITDLLCYTAQKQALIEIVMVIGKQLNTYRIYETHRVPAEP